MPTATPTSRFHLKLVPVPPAARRPGSRAWQALRAGLTLAVLALVTLRSWISLALAMAPLLWRPAPVGRRVRPLETRQARVIPFQPPRTAVPR